MSETEREIRKIFVEVTGVDKVDLDSSIFDDLAADSLAVEQILAAIEERFKIAISAEEAQDLGTVRDVVEFVEKRRRRG
jgi:acyl carrier protein